MWEPERVESFWGIKVKLFVILMHALWKVFAMFVFVS